MTDEAKPPKKKPAGAAKRPRKPAADAAKRLRKTPAKMPAADPAADSAAPTDEAVAEGAAPDENAAASAAQDEAVAESAAPDEAVTEIVAPDDAATQTVAADAAPTQVIDGAVAESTQVMSAEDEAATAPPPPPTFAPLPRVATPAGGGDRNTTLWLVLAIAAVAILAFALVWAFALRDGGERFVGSWAPISGEGGGLVIAMTDGDYDVSMYDADLMLTGTYPAARDGDALTFRFTDTQTQLGLVKARLSYVEDRDALILRLTAMGEEGAAFEFARVDALEPAPGPSPTPAPSVTSSPTASPTASPSGSPSPTPSPTGTDSAQLDQQVVDGIVAIQVGVLNWAAANGSKFPLSDEVTASGGIGQYVSPWPTNPYTGQPMAVSAQAGDYTYEQLNGGQGYKLVGHLANGLTFTVP